MKSHWVRSSALAQPLFAIALVAGMYLNASRAYAAPSFSSKPNLTGFSACLEAGLALSQKDESTFVTSLTTCFSTFCKGMDTKACADAIEDTLKAESKKIAKGVLDNTKNLIKALLSMNPTDTLRPDTVQSQIAAALVKANPKPASPASAPTGSGGGGGSSTVTGVCKSLVAGVAFSAALSLGEAWGTELTDYDKMSRCAGAYTDLERAFKTGDISIDDDNNAKDCVRDASICSSFTGYVSKCFEFAGRNFTDGSTGEQKPGYKAFPPLDAICQAGPRICPCGGMESSGPTGN